MNPKDSPKEEGSGYDATGTVTIAAPGAGKRIYLIDLAAKSDAAATLAVASPVGTTKFSVPIAANEGFEKQWGRGVVGTENAAMVITVSAGNTHINYGYVVA